MPTKISRRWGEQVRDQNWLALSVDFFIVVLGVFLGIQAANWNESRKERSEERRYYAQILDDLRLDQLSLQRAQQRANDFDNAAENTLQAMSNGIPQDLSPGRFAVDIHLAGFLYIPRPARRSYDELISTGNLGLLRSGDAKGAIAEYYASFEELRQWDELLRLQQGRYWELTSGVLPRPVLKAAIRGREPSLTDAEATQILTAMRERDGADLLLISMAAHQERIRRDSEQLTAMGRALITKLERIAGS